MASQHEANRARDEFSQFLMGLGAHAIAVDEIKRGGAKTFAVIAYFERKPSKPIPDSLEVKSGSRTTKVPLSVRVMEAFKPE
jgi:hypothetical protein